MSEIIKLKSSNRYIINIEPEIDFDFFSTRTQNCLKRGQITTNLELYLLFEGNHLNKIEGMGPYSIKEVHSYLLQIKIENYMLKKLF